MLWLSPAETPVTSLKTSELVWSVRCCRCILGAFWLQHTPNPDRFSHTINPYIHTEAIMSDYSNDETTGFAKGLLIGMLTGGAVGAALALLFAPKSGRELRSDIQYKTNQYKDKAGELVVAASERAQQIVNEGRKRAETLVDDARERASSLLNDAERIVSDARAKATTGGSKAAGEVKASAGKFADAVKAGTDAFKEELRNPSAS